MAPDGHVGSNVILAGQLMTGGVLSITVTVCVAVVELPEPSVAVQVMVVVPTGKVFPDGERLTDTEQLSLAVAVPGSTTVSQVVAPGPVYAVTFAGGVMVGGVLSTTVNVMVFSVTLP